MMKPKALGQRLVGRRAPRPTAWFLLVMLTAAWAAATPVRAAEKPALPKEPLSLGDVIEIALAKSARVKAAEHDVDEAARASDATRGLLFPRVDAFGDYQYSGFDRKNETRLGANIMRMPRFGVSPSFPASREFDNSLFSAGIQLRYPLYVGGRIVAGLEASRQGIVLARERLAGTKADLIFNLASTYHAILQGHENIKALDGSIKALDEARKNIQAQVEVGRAPRVDLLKVNTRLAAVRQALTRARSDLETGQGALNTLMGLDDVTVRLPLKGPLAFQLQAFDLRQGIADAVSRRPEVRAQERQVNILEQQVRIARAERLPQVELRSQYAGLTGERRALPILDDFTAGIHLTVPLFAGGAIVSRIREAEARLARGRADLDRIRLDVSQEVQAAYLRVGESAERVTTAETAVAEAREALRIEQLKTEVGKGVVEDLLDAQAAELQSEANYFQALADYNTALAGYRRGIGTIYAK